MKYLLLCCTEEKTLDAMSKSECEALMDATSAYCEALQKSDQLIVAEPLEPVHMAMTVRVRNGKLSVTDGPFAETKELIAGYTLIEVGSREEAREWTRRFPNPALEGGECEIEVRPLFDLDDFEQGPEVDRFRDLELPSQKEEESR